MVMPSYAAFLGHQPHISIAELSAVVPGFTMTRIYGKKDAITFDASEELPGDLIDTLGGTICMAEALSEGALTLDDIPTILHAEVSSCKGKVTFGLRTVGLPPKAVKLLYRSCKTHLKKKDMSSRYIGTEKKPAAAVLLHESGILQPEYGCELTILQDEDTFWVGRTVGMQDIDYYSWRDMDKPVRDTGVGLLPPKLAQIMLNFGFWLHEEAKKRRSEEAEAKASKKSKDDSKLTVLDPFCGTGVIPMEALLRSWNVVASDISQKAVSGTQKNLDWLRKEEEILKKDLTSDVSKHDATKPFALKNLPDIVVTETSLGENLEKVPSATAAKAHRKENEELQEQWLRNAAETLPGVPLVCIFPVWKTKKESIFLEKIWNVIDELPYEPVLPIEHPEGTRTSLVYKRPDQFVGREIVILRPI